MIFGTRISAPLAILLCLMQAPASAATPEWTLSKLLAAIHPQSSVSVPFSESKTSPLTKTPALSHGIMTFTPPARIEKHTITPIEETTVFENGTMNTRTVIEKSYRTSSIAIGSHPLLQASAGSIIALFTADEAAIMRDYTTELTGDAESWKLLLTPRAEVLRDALRHITLHGGHGQVQQVIVATTKRGTSTLTFGSAQP